MPTFEYEAVSSSGQPLSGTVEALDRAEAIRLLRRRGETATRVDPAGSRVRRVSKANGTAAPARATASWGESATPIKKVGRVSMSRAEMATFVREIATALEAGLPLMNALRAVLKQSSSERQTAIVTHLLHRIESGRSLAQAASEWGAPFDDMVVGMLRAGEASGKLDVVMMQLADLLDRDAELRRSVQGALVYPAILLVLLTVGVGIIVAFIIPRVLATIDVADGQLPLPTQIVKGTADFLAAWWWLVLGGAAIAVFAWKAALQRPAVRLKYDRTMLRVPVVGALLRDVAVGRFTRTMGTLMASGIPVLEALVITRDTLGNKAMERVIDEVAEKIRAGKSIAEPMERSGFFPALLIQIISLGERSGRLDQMLTHAANSFDRRTKDSIKLFTTVLPPVIVVVMAVVIGFVLAAVLLPLVEMQSNIG